MRAGRNIDRVPEAVWPQPGVQCVQSDPGLDLDAGRLGFQIDHIAQELTAIDYETCADRLAALRGARAARYDWDLMLACDVNNGGQILFSLRDNNPNRPDLINRRIGCIARSTERIKMHFPREFPLEMLGQIATRHRAVDHGR